jgi:AAA domain
MTVAEQLIKWASDLPGWQQDLVARLAEVPDLGANELKEVRTNLLAAYGGPAAGAPPRRVSAEALVPADTTSPAPRIRAIESLKNVNALAPGRRLEFAEDGLSVVYGENAVGKSGYCRVFKRVCRSVDRDATVLRNVFNPGSGPQKATFEVVDPGGSVRPVELDLAEEPPAEFAMISVFDAECADNYVTKANTVAFTPVPLLIFDRLVHAQASLEAGLEAEVADLRGTAPDLEEFDSETSTGALVRGLTPQTDPDALSAAAKLSENDRARLTELRAVGGTDTGEVARLAARADTDATSARNLQRSLRTLDAVVNGQNVSRLSGLRSDAETKAKAAELARSKAFDGQPMAAVGDSVWHELWQAARRFHEHSTGVEGSFPPAAHGDSCPLCLRPLDDQARERFANFEEFVRSTTAAEAKAATDAERDARDHLDQGLVAACRTEFLEFLRAERGELATTIETYLEAASIRLERLQIHDSDLPSLPELPLAGLETYAVERTERAAEIRDDTARTAAERELAELVAREQLSKRLEPILVWRDRQAQIAILEKAIGALGTRGITQAQKRIAAEVITEALRNALREELDLLGLEDVAIDLDPSGERGRTVVRLSFGDAADEAPVRVLSKGEQRAAALAFFLAEVRVSGGDGGVVLDDPVSSLDEPRRHAVAARLATEAAKRQVIVFTHDLVLFVRLDKLGNENGGPPYKVQQVWRGSEVGLTSADAPWPGQNVKARIAYLRRRVDDFPDAEKLGPEGFRREIKGWYEQLRETWERAVEEVLFNDVIQRFRPSVETKRLERAPDLTPARRNAVEHGVERCSAFIHDEAPAGEMTRERLREDLDAIKSFVDEIRKPSK